MSLNKTLYNFPYKAQGSSSHQKSRIWACGTCGAKMIYTAVVTQPAYRCSCDSYAWLPVTRQSTCD